jgi:hypothetical protein
MRCSSTNQFASFDDEPEIEDYGSSVDGDTVTIEAHVARMCAECGSEAAEADLSLEISGVRCPKAPEDDPNAEGHELMLNDVEFEGVDEYQTHDRHGKPIKNYRYSRHYIGASAIAKLECECGEEFDSESVEDKLAASWFEDTYH